MKRNFNYSGKGLRLSKAEAAEYGLRSGEAKRRRQRVEQWCIEGEYVTSQQMAERCGMTVDEVHRRLMAAQKLPGPVTWARLRGDA